jgi:hypothetical protein
MPGQDCLVVGFIVILFIMEIVYFSIVHIECRNQIAPSSDLDNTWSLTVVECDSDCEHMPPTVLLVSGYYLNSTLESQVIINIRLVFLPLNDAS